MRLTVDGRTLRCVVCMSEDFSRRYFSGFGKGALLPRKRGLAFGVNSARVARHYACDVCSWTATFAGDSPSSPEEQS